MNSEALRLLDGLSDAIDRADARSQEIFCELRALLSAQDDGWRPMSERPKDRQRIVYWFEPFNQAFNGTFYTATGVEGDDLDYVAGKSGFTTVDPEVPWWMPVPDELAKQEAK